MSSLSDPATTPAIRWDPHVHAAPSTRSRWGTDLDLIDAAGELEMRGFVLKSHHESTAARAVVANEYARRSGIEARATGSIVLNPWISLTELERALALGARVVWWPTLDHNGHKAGLALPRLHDTALSLLVKRGRILIETGHLSADAARQLVADAGAAGLDVVVSHPLNPKVGMGIGPLERLVADGAMVELDALSIRWLGPDAEAALLALRGLIDAGATGIVSSDGGQAENGNPFEFLRAEIGRATSLGLESQISQLLACTDELMGGLVGDA